MTEEEEDAMYAQIGQRRAAAFFESQRHTKYTFMAGILNGWTSEEITHYIKTGEQPAGKDGI